GCRVFRRPSIISGKPVCSATSLTGTPAAFNAAAVPPVDRISTPPSARAAASSITPDLSETEISARWIRDVWAVIGLAFEFHGCFRGRYHTRTAGGTVRAQFVPARAARLDALEAPVDRGFAGGGRANHDLPGRCRALALPVVRGSLHQ